MASEGDKFVDAAMIDDVEQRGTDRQGGRLKAILVNLSLAAGSVVLTLLALEIALALFVDVTDNLEYAHLEDVGLYLRPEQEGLYARAGIDGGRSIKAHFKVNNVGFNNGRDYVEERTSGRYRIAVVGDSFVEALQVDYQETFFYRLEGELAARGIDAEVYTFGVSGAGAAHAYHMVDQVVMRYAPDLVIHVFVANDLKDTALRRAGRRWFPRYELDADGELVFRSLDHYRLPFAKRLFRSSRLVRFFLYQHHGKARLSTWRRPAGRSLTTAADPAAQRAGLERAWRLVDLLLARIDQRLTAADIPWLVVWAGTVDPDYYREMRQHLEEIVARRDIRYFDPSGDFVAAATHPEETFRFRGDGHWDPRGHEVLGSALARVLLELRLDGLKIEHAIPSPPG